MLFEGVTPSPHPFNINPASSDQNNGNNNHNTSSSSSNSNSSDSSTKRKENKKMSDGPVEQPECCLTAEETQSSSVHQDPTSSLIATQSIPTVATTALSSPFITNSSIPSTLSTLAACVGEVLPNSVYSASTEEILPFIPPTKPTSSPTAAPSLSTNTTIRASSSEKHNNNRYHLPQHDPSPSPPLPATSGPTTHTTCTSTTMSMTLLRRSPLQREDGLWKGERIAWSEKDNFATPQLFLETLSARVGDKTLEEKEEERGISRKRDGQVGEVGTEEEGGFFSHSHRWRSDERRVVSEPLVSGNIIRSTSEIPLTSQNRNALAYPPVLPHGHPQHPYGGSSDTSSNNRKSNHHSSGDEDATDVRGRGYPLHASHSTTTSSSSSICSSSVSLVPPHPYQLSHPPMNTSPTVGGVLEVDTGAFKRKAASPSTPIPMSNPAAGAGGGSSSSRSSSILLSNTSGGRGGNEGDRGGAPTAPSIYRRDGRPPPSPARCPSPRVWSGSVTRTTPVTTSSNNSSNSFSSSPRVMSTPAPLISVATPSSLPPPLPPPAGSMSSISSRSATAGTPCASSVPLGVPRRSPHTRSISSGFTERETEILGPNDEPMLLRPTATSTNNDYYRNHSNSIHSHTSNSTCGESADCSLRSSLRGESRTRRTGLLSPRDTVWVSALDLGPHHPYAPAHLEHSRRSTPRRLSEDDWDNVLLSTQKPGDGGAGSRSSRSPFVAPPTTTVATSHHSTTETSYRSAGSSERCNDASSPAGYRSASTSSASSSLHRGGEGEYHPHKMAVSSPFSPPRSVDVALEAPPARPPVVEATPASASSSCSLATSSVSLSPKEGEGGRSPVASSGSSPGVLSPPLGAPPAQVLVSPPPQMEPWNTTAATCAGMVAGASKASSASKSDGGDDGRLEGGMAHFSPQLYSFVQQQQLLHLYATQPSFSPDHEDRDRRRSPLVKGMKKVNDEDNQRDDVQKGEEVRKEMGNEENKKDNLFLQCQVPFASSLQSNSGVSSSEAMRMRINNPDSMPSSEPPVPSSTPMGEMSNSTAPKTENSTSHPSPPSTSIIMMREETEEIDFSLSSFSSSSSPSSPSLSLGSLSLVEIQEGNKDNNDHNEADVDAVEAVITHSVDAYLDQHAVNLSHLGSSPSQCDCAGGGGELVPPEHGGDFTRTADASPSTPGRSAALAPALVLDNSEGCLVSNAGTKDNNSGTKVRKEHVNDLHEEGKEQQGKHTHILPEGGESPLERAASPNCTVDGNSAIRRREEQGNKDGKTMLTIGKPQEGNWSASNADDAAEVLEEEKFNDSVSSSSSTHSISIDALKEAVERSKKRRKAKNDDVPSWE